MPIQKGDIVRVWKNRVFKQMGFCYVTGEVFLIYEGGQKFALRCDQTQAMELIVLADSTVEIITQIDSRRRA